MKLWLGKLVVNGNGGNGGVGTSGSNLGLYRYYIRVESQHVITCPGYQYYYTDDLVTLVP